MSGEYVLEMLDGVRMPALDPNFLTCPGAVRYGVLFLSLRSSQLPETYFWDAVDGSTCDTFVPPAAPRVIVADAGYWSATKSRVNFRSNSSYRQGNYSSTVEQDDSAPLLEFSVGGHTMRYRRGRELDYSTGSLTISVRESNGSFVNGAVFQFRSADGFVSNGVTNNDRAFGTGTRTGVQLGIHTKLPTGYSFAPGQDNPVLLLASPRDTVVIRAVRSGS
ncbi:MAG: hypothetical protein WKF55_01485 [Gemmatimonadaceae bacterium]